MVQSGTERENRQIQMVALNVGSFSWSVEMFTMKTDAVVKFN